MLKIVRKQTKKEPVVKFSQLKVGDLFRQLDTWNQDDLMIKTSNAESFCYEHNAYDLSNVETACCEPGAKVVKVKGTLTWEDETK